MSNARAVALGFFDGVHLGHGALLRRTRELAEALHAAPAALTFVPHPSALLSAQPVPLLTTPDDRALLMRRLYGVDELLVLPFDAAMRDMPWETFVEDILMKRYNAKALVCGQDYRFGARGAGTPARLAEKCAETGVAFSEVAEVRLDGQKVSSSAVRAFLAQGDAAAAARFLGHPHLLRGTVVGGQKLGRTLGIPTANLALAPEILLPRYGVYAAKAYFDGAERLAVVNIGVRPTVHGDAPTVEPWILDHDGDLYGHALTLALHAFLRPERKFPTLAALTAEAQKNAQQTRTYFNTR